MDDETIASRLSRIATNWELLAGAREAGTSDAWLPLFRRYQGAAYRYLLGAVRDPDAADDLFQDFAVRVVQGAFRGANPQRGRFRDYLKSALFHLIVDHQKRRRKRPWSLNQECHEPQVQVEETPSADAEFLHSWRDELLARAWAALENAERTGGLPYYTILKLRTENTELSSAEMAAELNRRLGSEPAFTETSVRKALQRARAKYADYLLDEVAHSLHGFRLDELEQELIDLGLLDYCRAALNRHLGRT
jgi:RNA polymerase sigma-70 factor (ECF subfamily)